MELFKTVREYLMALYLSFRYISIKLNGKLSRRHFINYFDVSALNWSLTGVSVVLFGKLKTCRYFLAGVNSKQSAIIYFKMDPVLYCVYQSFETCVCTNLNDPIKKSLCPVEI